VRVPRIAVVFGLIGMLAACAAPTSPPQRQPPEARRGPSGQSVDPQIAARLHRTMVPLLRAMDNPRPPNQVRVGIIDDPQINAASGGSGEFYVTTGLLQKANDEQLTAILAHEVAHDDLGHVAKQQALGAGLSIATILLDQLIPGSGAVTPIAGTLVARAYSRSEEHEADRHGVEILRRANVPKPKEAMINTLTWLMQVSGPSEGGFFSTHPGTVERIEAIQKMR